MLREGRRRATLRRPFAILDVGGLLALDRRLERAPRGDTQPEQRESTQRFTARELAVNEVERDFLLEIATQRHDPSLPICPNATLDARTQYAV